jgi:hypothetical protein
VVIKEGRSIQELGVHVYGRDSKLKRVMSVTDLRSLEFCAAFLDVLPRQAGAEDGVPVDEPGLRKVGFDADGLVVYVVVVCRIATDHLERVERKAIPTVVVHCFAGGKDEEKHRLANRELREGLGEEGTERVEQNALKRMVVKRTVRVGHI